MYELIYVIMLTIVTPTDVIEKPVAFSLREDICILLAAGAGSLEREYNKDDKMRLAYSCRPVKKEAILEILE